jgi:transcriptional regulator with XRE-family HTH domain
MRAIGQRILRCRFLLGWSQRDLAERSGIAHATVSRLERGLSSDMRHYTLVAAALGVSRDILTTEDEGDAHAGIVAWYQTRTGAARRPRLVHADRSLDGVFAASSSVSPSK